jgi:hypothetical protein
MDTRYRVIYLVLTVSNVDDKIMISSLPFIYTFLIL